MDGPPSFTSVVTRNTDLQKPQSFDAGTAARATVQPTETYNDNDNDHVEAVSIGSMALGGRGIQLQDNQLMDIASYHNEPALSIGDMALGNRGSSQPAGSKFSDVANTPPSLTDAARRDESQTSETGGGENLPEGNYEEMSITGRDFERVYPMMSQKEDGHNPFPF